MKKDDIEELDSVLTSIKNLSGVEGGAIIARNGVLIASSLPQGVDGQKFAAMAASMVGASETAAALLNSFARMITIEIDRGKILALGAGPKAILVVLAGENADVEKLIKKIDKHRKEVMKILK
ncbi:MAG: roadblock/LC7 domain-containing protein [Candidatus Freyarchaeota archaeon]|nr:roadblock/LC7 domain-containing protein [Candidatus Freyarchaeota archaeon]